MSSSKKTQASFQLTLKPSVTAAPAGAKAKKAKRRKGKGKKGAGSETLATIPAAQTFTVTTGAARLQSITADAVRVAHREYIGEVSGSVDYAAGGYGINPGLATTFPWLSAVANQYESYLFRKLAFEFVTSKGSSTVGSVMLAVDFDALDWVPTSKAEFMQYSGAARSSVWSGCVYECLKSNLQKFGIQRYTRHGSVSGDLKTYDVGSLMVATQGCADTTVIGELYVEYVVDLFTPHIPVGPEAYSAKVYGHAGITKTAPFRAANTVVTGDTDLIDVVNDTDLRFKRPGEFLIEFFAGGAGLQDPGDFTLGGATVANDSDGVVNATGNLARFARRIRIPSANGVYRPGWTASTSLSDLVTRIAPYDFGTV